MRALTRFISRFAAILGVSILAISSVVWVFFHTEGFTQPIDFSSPTPTPLPLPTPTLAPGVPTPTPAIEPIFLALSSGPPIILLGLAGLVALLVLLLLLLVFTRGQRKNQPVKSPEHAPALSEEGSAGQAAGQPIPVHGQPATVILQRSSRGDTVLNVTIGLVTTIAGAIIGHYWHKVVHVLTTTLTTTVRDNRIQ